MQGLNNPFGASTPSKENSFATEISGGNLGQRPEFWCSKAVFEEKQETKHKSINAAFENSLNILKENITHSKLAATHQACYLSSMANTTAILETTLGNITIELFTDKMPQTAGNFVDLAKNGFYDGLHFHRVIKGFMLQFGCPHSKDPNSASAGTGNGPNGCIQDEHPADAKFSNKPGTISMANTNRPNSGSSQFFLNTVDNARLDWFSPGNSKHPVFGKVTEGMDVVTKIENTPTGRGDNPTTPVKMIKVSINE